MQKCKCKFTEIQIQVPVMSPPELNVLHKLHTNTGIPAKLIKVKPRIDQKMGEVPSEAAL